MKFFMKNNINGILLLGDVWNLLIGLIKPQGFDFIIFLDIFLKPGDEDKLLDIINKEIISE